MSFAATPLMFFLFLFLAAMAASGGCLRLFLRDFLAGFGLSWSDAEQELSSESSGENDKITLPPLMVSSEI